MDIRGCGYRLLTFLGVGSDVDTYECLHQINHRLRVLKVIDVDRDFKKGSQRILSKRPSLVNEYAGAFPAAICATLEFWFLKVGGSTLW